MYSYLVKREFYHDYVLKLCSSGKEYCHEAVETAIKVEFCPTSKEEWNRAASKKECNVWAERQNCTTSESFVYHCVIDGLRTITLELCAPETIIFGNVFVEFKFVKL